MAPLKLAPLKLAPLKLAPLKRARLKRPHGARQAVLQLRLGYAAAKWRNVYKALTVLEFLVRRGAARCVALARSELLPKLEDLEAFQFVAPDGRDQGVNVRHRCAAARLGAVCGAAAGRCVSGAQLQGGDVRHQAGRLPGSSSRAPQGTVSVMRGYQAQ